MLLELSVIPLGRGRSISADVADLVKIIDASGLDYQLTAAGTILEGSWEQLMDVARKCHTEMRKKTERVVTFMNIPATVRELTDAQALELQVIELSVVRKSFLR